MSRIDQVTALYWSATGNTKQVVCACAAELSECLSCGLREIDFTPGKARREPLEFSPGELVVAGSPTYAGKLPNKILPDFQTKLIGHGTPAIALVTFGNRSFDNALAELTETLKTDGFTPVGAAAFACRHAFSDRLAPGRPDETDLEEDRAFARRIAERILSGEAIEGTLSVPGDAAAPYYVPRGVDGEPAKFLKAKPKTDPKKCTKCGDCVRLCPMGSINPADPADVAGICIKCQACIRGCPERAKYFDDPAFLSHITMLEKIYLKAKKNDFYFLK